MVALNFKLEFANLVEDGIKRQSIRAQGKRSGPRVFAGMMLQLYTGQRTKACRKLRDAICVETLDFEVTHTGHLWCDLYLPGLTLNVPELALLDGFNSEAFRNFFPPGFNGYIYRWDVAVKDMFNWWRYVYPSHDGGAYMVPSGRCYVLEDKLFSGAIGLMCGIPVDWVIV